MPAIRLVTVSGPRGAGKETIVTALCSELKLHRIAPHTTRSPRPSEQHGREYFFVPLQDFEAMLRAGEFVYHAKIGETQRSGTHRGQFLVSESGSVIDITPSGARTLRDIVRKELNGMTLTIGVFADAEERRKRIRARDPTIDEAEVMRLMSTDPVSPHLHDYSDFDLVIDNSAPTPLIAQQRALSAARDFLHCSV